MDNNTDEIISCPFCLHNSLRADKCTNCDADLDKEVSEEKGMLYIPYWIELTIDFSKLNREIFPQVFALVKEYWKKTEEYTILSLYPSQLHQFEYGNYTVKLIALDYAIEAIKKFLKRQLGVDVPLMFSSTELDDEIAKVRLHKKD